MGQDTKYLRKQNGIWCVRIKVPLEAREAIGQVNLTKSLNTSHLPEANRIKSIYVGRFKEMIRDAMKGRIDPLIAEASRYRKDVIAGDDAALAGAEHRAEEIAASRGAQRAQTFHAVASGAAVPLEHYLARYLEASGLTERVQEELRRGVGWLKAWCRKRGIEETIAAITRKRAASFTEEVLGTGGRTVRTANKYLSSLAGYWKWLDKKVGEVDGDNPWHGQRLAQPKAHLRRGGVAKRPFTDGEMRTLFEGGAKQPLADIMLIAALSGMRLEEITSLRIMDVTAGYFDVTKGKTPAAVRQVPIHSSLASMVSRRASAGAPAALLFPELPPPAPCRAADDRLSPPISKAFGRYRLKLGIEERAAGSKTSNIDFHSFRRWFISKAGRALTQGAQGFTAWTLADVVGHDRKRMELPMTFGVYQGGADLAAKRACVEAVALAGG